MLGVVISLGKVPEEGSEALEKHQLSPKTEI